MVNVQPQTQQPISDDQELAKVLAGVSNQPDDTTASDTPLGSTLNFEETGAAPAPVEPAEAPEAETSDAATTPAIDTPVEPPTFDTPLAAPTAPAPTGDLESIKSEALTELRPLVDKLNVSPEEKFDTYLLLLRSTDDKELIAPAHAAAQAITDETKKAQALLDIIKEIDYLTNPQQAQA